MGALEKAAPFGSLMEGDPSIIVYCSTVLFIVLAITFFKDKVLMKAIKATLPSEKKKRKMGRRFRLLLGAMEALQDMEQSEDYDDFIGLLMH